VSEFFLVPVELYVEGSYAHPGSHSGQLV
jgi:hypothetical protein